MAYDPFGIFGPPDDELSRRRALSSQPGGNPLLAQAQGPPPLQKEEADSLLSKVADTGLGALHFVGSTIDKTVGARAIRGALGGKANELLSLIPGSDTLGITDEKDRVSGEDLLKNWGVLQGDGEKGTFEMRDLAGPALELALDPSTYLTLGTGAALTAAGRVAKNAGLLPGKATARMAGFAAGTPELAALAGKMAVPEADLAGKALSGLAGFGAPLSHPSAIVGTGDTAKAFAGWLEQKAQGMMYGKVGTALSRMFDPAVHNATTPAVQKVNREFLDPALAAGNAAAHGTHLDQLKVLEPLGLADHAQSAPLRLAAEGIAPAAGPAEQAAADTLRSLSGARRGEAAGIGRDVADLQDQYAAYGYRQQTLDGKATKGYGAGRLKEMNPSAPAEIARQEALRDVPRGTVGVNEVGRDATLRGYNDAGQEALAAQHVRANHLGMSPADDQRLFALNNQAKATGLSAAEIAERQALQANWDKAPHLAGWNATLDPRYAAEGLDFFGNHPLTDFTLGQIAHNRAQAGGKAIHELLANNLSTQAGPGTVSATDALKQVGLGHEVLNAETGASTGGRSYLLGLLKSKDPAKYATASIADLDHLHVPASLVEDAAKVSRAVKTPEAVAPLVAAWDSITNLTKAGQTSLWPSFHTRNAVTGLWQNLVGGAYDPKYHPLNPLAWITPYRDAMAMKNNGVVPRAAEIFKDSHPGITDAEATRLLAEQMFVNGTRVSPHTTQAGEAIGRGTLGAPVPLHLPGTGHEVPIADALNPAKLWREMAAKPGATMNPLSSESMLSPLNVRGVGDAAETGNVAVRYGQQLGATVDELHRMSAHIAYARQGVEAGEATARSKALHYDFSRMTDVEREVMRRVIPFYSWTRKNVPFQIAELAQRPGGLAGSTVKGLDNLRSQGGFVPDSVSEGMAIPVGKEDATGTSRFLTHFGLPVEDAFSMIGTGASPIQSTGEKILGMSNPLIKMPAELIANKQFYSGRHIDDLYSRTGNPLLDQVIMNSPASRFLTTGGQLADPRKSLLDKVLGVVGPAKIADVDTNKAREVSARDYIDKTLKAGNAAKSFETLYVPPDQMANMSPEETRMYQLYKYLEQQRMAQAKAAKANQGVK